MFNSEVTSLEDYLEQIVHELRDLPSQARADEMREIESHLRTMIEARGDVAEVLAQFGKPRKVGRDLRRAWERKQSEPLWCAGTAILFAINFYFFITFPAIDGLYTIHQFIQMNPNSVAAFEVFLVNAQFLIFLLMFVASFIMGLVSPKRNYLSVTAFLIMMSIPNSINELYADFTLRLILTANFIIAAAIGSYFGARHGRRLLSRITDAN